MNTKKTEERKRRTEPLIVFLITVLSTITVTIAFGNGTEELIRNTITAVIGAGVLCYQLVDTFMHKDFAYNNSEHPLRMLIIWILCLSAALVFSRISFLAWPYAAVFVLLSLFTDALTGMYAGTFLLLLSVLLGREGDATAFFMYMIIGVVAVVLFRRLDEDLHVMSAILTTLCIQFLMLVTYYVLFLHVELRLDIFVIPLINIGVTFVLLFVITHIFAMAVVRKDSDRYMDVNDPEFPLLAAIRRTERAEYFRAVHTAYLSERIAADLKLNTRAIKSLAYYHRIGVLDDNVSSFEKVAHYFDEFAFPKEAVALCEEYISRDGKNLVSKEATIVMFCDTIVAHLTKTFRINKDAHPDYDELIDNMINEKVSAGELNGSDLSYRELERVRALLKREKLYYDFLR